METINIAVVEDDPVIHESLVRSIEMYPAMNLVFSAFSAEDALTNLASGKFIAPDVILLDIGLPGMTGLEAIGPIKERVNKTDIIMLTTYEENEKIFAALCSGACSYISKKTSLKVIMDSVFTVYRGGSYMSPSIARKIANHFLPLVSDNGESKIKLTDRQMDIIKELSEGKSYKLIAEALNISIDTVRSHIKKIYSTLEVNSKIEVLNMFREGKLG